MGDSAEREVPWSGWLHGLDGDYRKDLMGTAPSVGWCPSCRLLVVAYYTGHGIDACQHCGTECDSLEMAKAIPSERWGYLERKPGQRIRYCTHCGMKNVSCGQKGVLDD
jgi:hypothetical protein